MLQILLFGSSSDGLPCPSPAFLPKKRSAASRLERLRWAQANGQSPSSKKKSMWPTQSSDQCTGFWWENLGKMLGTWGWITWITWFHGISWNSVKISATKKRLVTPVPETTNFGMMSSIKLVMTCGWLMALALPFFLPDCSCWVGKSIHLSRSAKKKWRYNLSHYEPYPKHKVSIVPTFWALNYLSTFLRSP